jgi:hypothetical protein
MGLVKRDLSSESALTFGKSSFYLFLQSTLVVDALDFGV